MDPNLKQEILAVFPTLLDMAKRALPSFSAASDPNLIRAQQIIDRVKSLPDPTPDPTVRMD